MSRKIYNGLTLKTIRCEKRRKRKPLPVRHFQYFLRTASSSLHRHGYPLFVRLFRNFFKERRI